MKKTRKRRSKAGLNLLIPCISTTLVLILLGLVVFFVATGDKIGRSLRENFTLSLMLDDHTTKQEAYQLQTMLRAMPSVKQTAYISKERATREQAEALGADPADFLGSSPVPASFEVFMKAEYANSDSLARIIPVIRTHPRVIDVIYPQELMDSVNDNIRKVSLVLLAIAALLMLVSFSLINNTIRLNIYASRFIIHTMKLVGARWSFIRRPFMWHAFWVGFISALCASAALTGGVAVLIDWEPTLQELIGWEVVALSCAAILTVGMLMTLSCAFFSVNKHLRMRGDEVYMK